MSAERDALTWLLRTVDSALRGLDEDSDPYVLALAIERVESALEHAMKMLARSDQEQRLNELSTAIRRREYLDRYDQN